VQLVLFGGPAGAGKSTLARACCATRERAVHVELDAVRELIVAGRADPQHPNPLQAEQYVVSVDATCALARAFLAGGYDVAVDDTLEPAPFEAYWQPRIERLIWKVVIILPSLDETLARSAGRAKRVLEAHTRAQHTASLGWATRYRVDTTGRTPEESLPLVQTIIASQVSAATD
jgi:predicted kinase